MIYGDSTLSDVTNLPNSVFKLEFYEDENGDGYYDHLAVKIDMIMNLM